MKTTRRNIKLGMRVGFSLAALIVLAAIGAAQAASPVLESDNFNRTSLGASWSQWTYNPSAAPAPPWYSIINNSLAATNALPYFGDTGYTAYDTDYALFSSPHPTEPYEIVQANIIDSDVLAGLSLHMNSLSLGSQYVMRIRPSDEYMSILKIVSGVLQYNLTNAYATVALQQNVQYTLKGITDNNGHLRFEVWSTDGNGNPLALLDSLSAYDNNVGGFSAMSGGYAGLYTLYEGSNSEPTWDNFSVLIPEPAASSLLLLSALLLLRRITRR